MQLLIYCMALHARVSPVVFSLFFLQFELCIPHPQCGGVTLFLQAGGSDLTLLSR